jgi:hypothetical protein
LRDGGYARPNQTCLDLFPLADPNKFPWEHSILQHYIDGTLDTVITDDDADFNATYEFMIQSQGRSQARSSLTLRHPSCWHIRGWRNYYRIDIQIAKTGSIRPEHLRMKTGLISIFQARSLCSL